MLTARFASRLRSVPWLAQCALANTLPSRHYLPASNAGADPVRITCLSLSSMLQPACRDGACLLWSHVNYEHPYPERARKLELGEYSGRSKSQVPPQDRVHLDPSHV